MIVFILLVVGLFSAFFKLADSHDRNGWIYGGIGPVSWFGTQFIVGIIITIISPQILSDTSSIFIFGLGSGLIGTIVTYMLIRNHFIKNPKKSSKYKNEDILDN